MESWSQRSKALKERLSLATQPIGYRRFEKAAGLDSVPGVTRWAQGCMFCQVPFMARVAGLTIGLLRDGKLADRCKRINGLLATDEGGKLSEAKLLSRTWMPSVEEALKQQEDYPRVPAGEALVVGPLVKDNFEPEVVMVYGNPAQIMMLMCGLQKIKYERFEFHFIGEGACVDSLGQCYNTGKPALAIPCYGERSMGQVKDDEIVIALPPPAVEQAIAGLEVLEKIGFKYPISNIGAFADPEPMLARFYPKKKRETKEEP
jgi:uncharacterized protein (DUF169 family)